jgi:replication factor A1
MSFSRKYMNIGELKSGMRNVSVTGKVESVGEPRTVNLRAGGTNTVADARISDETGSIKLSLWGDDINKIQPGDTVSIENGYIKGEDSINVGKFGNLKKV